MVASALHVSKETLEPKRPEERGSAGDFHRSLHRLDGGMRGEGAPDQNLAGRLGSHGTKGRGVEHVTEPEPRGRQLVLHLADQPLDRGIITALARDSERHGARGLGDPDVDRIDQRKRDRGRDVHREAPLSGRPAHADGGVRHEHVLQHRVVRSGAAHAERSPRVLPLHAGSVQRDGEVKNRRTVLRVVVDRHGHQQVACGRAAAEDLSAADPIAAVDLLGCARSCDPVRPAARDQNQLLRRDATKKRVDRGLLVAPSPGRDEHLMRVHVQRQRGRAAVGRQYP